MVKSDARGENSNTRGTVLHGVKVKVGGRVYLLALTNSDRDTLLELVQLRPRGPYSIRSAIQAGYTSVTSDRRPTRRQCGDGQINHHAQRRHDPHTSLGRHKGHKQWIRNSRKQINYGGRPLAARRLRRMAPVKRACAAVGSAGKEPRGGQVQHHNNQNLPKMKVRGSTCVAGSLSKESRGDETFKHIWESWHPSVAGQGTTQATAWWLP